MDAATTPMPDSLPEIDIVFKDSTFYYRTTGAEPRYTHTYYLGVLYGHPGAERRAAFLVKSGEALDILSLMALNPALAKVLGEGRPRTVEIFRRLLDA